MTPPVELPSGTVTFLFTDIEGSTRLLKQLGGRYVEALAHHRQVLRTAFKDHGGHEFGTAGDAMFVAFRRARDAVAAMVAGQLALAGQHWPGGAELRVGMGLHTGEPDVDEVNYAGLGVHPAARISSARRSGAAVEHDRGARRGRPSREPCPARPPRPSSQGPRSARAHLRAALSGALPALPPIEALGLPRVPTGARAPPLVEREAELATLDHALAAARSGTGAMVLVEGPAGIGKTSLLRAARERAAQSAMTVFHGRATELERDYPMGVVRLRARRGARHQTLGAPPGVSPSNRRLAAITVAAMFNPETTPPPTRRTRPPRTQPAPPRPAPSDAPSWGSSIIQALGYASALGLVLPPHFYVKGVGREER